MVEDYPEGVRMETVMMASLWRASDAGEGASAVRLCAEDSLAPHANDLPGGAQIGRPICLEIVHKGLDTFTRF